MKGSRLFTLVFFGFIVSTLASCGSDNTSNCAGPLNQQKSSYRLATDFGDGSDGEFYLANGDVFYLEEKVYNFSNVYLETGSRLTLSDVAASGTGQIEINSPGSCYFGGDIDYSGYAGSISINCASDLEFVAQPSLPDGGSGVNTLDVTISSNQEAATITLSNSSSSNLSITNNGSSDLLVTSPGLSNLLLSSGEVSNVIFTQAVEPDVNTGTIELPANGGNLVTDPVTEVPIVVDFSQQQLDCVK